MYAREIQGKLLTFGVSGKLIQNALVMYDRETDSLWSQALGSAVDGDYAGTDLEVLSASILPWSAWLERHPDTLVLDQGDFRTEPCDTSYDARGGCPPD